MELIHRKLKSKFKFVIPGILLLFTICFGASDEIRELARSLKGDPCLIYDYVKNHIDYVPYWNAVKGPTGTYLDGCGNDFDQASLMIALLRESGFTTTNTRYVMGYMLIPDTILANWFGVPNTPSAIDGLISARMPPRNSGAVLRVWVKVIVNGQTYYFDPALKAYRTNSKIDIGNAMQFTINNLSNFGTTGNDGGVGYVKDIDDSALVNVLETYSTNLTNVLKTQYPNTDISDILGARTMVNEPLAPISNHDSLPYPVVSSTIEYDSFPSNMVSNLQVVCGTISWQKNNPDIEGQRLTLTCDSLKNIILRLDGAIVATGTNTTNSKLKVTYNFPSFGEGKVLETPVAAPGMYAIVCNFQGVTHSTERLMKHQKRIAQYIAEGKTLTSEDVLGETLHSIGQRYIRSCLRTFQVGDKLFDFRFFPQYFFGVAGQNNSGYFVDFKLMPGSYSRTSDTLSVEQKNTLTAMSMVTSALEHETIDQTSGSLNAGISTSKGLEITNANGKKIYYIGSVSQLNYLKNNNLLKYSAEYLGSGQNPGQFKQYLDLNYQLIVPQDSSIAIGSSRSVPVYAAYNAAIGSSYYIIAGGLNGGYSMVPKAQIDATYVHQDISYSTFNCSVPKTSYNQISTISTPTAKDPVEMAGGAFTDNNTDLASAGSFPMAFTRQYSSNKNLEKTMLGYGWTHNYNIKLSVSSNSDAVMGSRRAIDAVPLIVAIYSSAKLMASANDARNWVTRSIIANWAVDQLLNNSVTISFGSKTIEFIRDSDESYNPPPGINAQLTKNPSGTYTMTERSGTKYEFNSSNKIKKITDIDGNKTQFEYDLLRKLKKVYDDYGHGFTFDYSDGLLTTVTDPISRRAVGYAYDTTGNLITFRDAENNAWTYTYDSLHRILTKIDPLNIVNVTNIYDGDKVSRQISPLQSGALDTSKFFISGYRNILENGAGYQTVYNFDYKGRSVSTTDPLGNSSTQEYDGENHTIASTDPCGRKTIFVYDGNNNLLETSRDSINKATFKYDTNFNLIEKTDAMGRKDSMFYDSKRHLIKQTVYPDNNSPITTSYTYFSNGLLQTATNPKGVVTSYCYDAKGNKTSTQYGNDPAIKYEYNSFGVMTKVTDPLNASVTDTVDKRGLTTRTEDALGKKTYITYYQNGLPFQETDRNNKQTTIYYTPSGKTDSITYSDGHKTVCTYNNLDQLVSVSDGSTTATFQYDTNGRVTSTTDIQGFTVANQFYPDGQLKKLIYPANFSITYTYDTLGRLKNVQDSLKNILASYDYDASGLITSTQFVNGNKTAYQYDGAGRMNDLIHSDMADTFANYHAILDESGYPVRITGNFTDSSVAAISNIAYAYDSLGTRLTSFGGTSITYDFEGQTTARGAQTYTFNARYQLDTVVGSGYTYLYTYDESGHRVKAVRNGVTTKYIYGGSSRILAEADSANVITRYYIYGHGLIGFYVPGTGFFACHYDMSGNMVAITDGTGAVAAKFSYTPFGEVIERTIVNPVCDVPVGFAGEYGILREPNGLYYMNARYYDPTNGRFLSEDPIGLSGGDLTLYSYAGNNPVVFVDPSGLCSQGSGSGVNSTAGAIAYLIFDATGTINTPGAQNTLKVLHAISDVASVGTMVYGGISPNQMNKMIKNNSAPNGLIRVDVGKIKGEQTHVHFDNGAALNKNGTWKHGESKIPNAAKKWLKDAGWTLP
ncbi:MAG: hypothetical protein GX639_11525 [Fibrobacter sp.]|nr:hypothetical protein [Fibrobacter sp.]